MSSPLLAWHFLREDRRTRYSNDLVEVGSILSAVGSLELCSNGMHASVDPLDALHYAPGPVICLVELSGEVLSSDDKLCARYRKCLAMANASTVLRIFAADCADRALDRVETRGGRVDPRSRAACRAARDYVNGLISAADLRAAAAAAAYAAAADAAAAAAYAAAAADAAAAAYAAAAADAAAAAADAAAYAAAAAADAAAYAAERKWQSDELTRRFSELLNLPS